jgi:two-component system nitrogen regulation response regulator GlnG
VAIDCGAIPETLLESELFGYEKGAFTGAVRQKPGKFEICQNGTLLLDEMFNMSMAAQAKLLRVLQERKINRIGGTQPVSMDVRLLVATNRDLEESSFANFRKDLFFRLCEFIIRIPPLRNRKEDIPYLANRFLKSTNLELQKNVKGFSEGAIDMLLSYDWPGNVRELRSLIRRAVLIADDLILEKHLEIKRSSRIENASENKKGVIEWKECSLKEIVRNKTLAVEREVLTEVLDYTDGNKAKAARLLKIDYKTIHNKLKSFGITPKGGKNGGSTE